MKIEKMNGLNDESTNDYLDITQLEDGRVYEKIALVTSASPGLTKQNSGFAKFFLKDVNANVVCARLFDVKDFAFCGVKLSSFKNKPAKLTFAAQEYNGSLSLIIDGVAGISVYNGDFDYSKFIGKMEYDEKFILDVYKANESQNVVINQEWKITPLDGIGQGRVGAFMKVFEIALSNILMYEEMNEVDTKELIEVLYEAMATLFVVKKNASTYGVFDDSKNFDYLMSLNQKWYDKDLRSVVMDTAKAVVGLTKPTHLYSHLVVNSINQAISNLDLILTNNSMVLGSSSYVGGVLLSKF